MKVFEVSYLRVKNLGNYEKEEIGLKAEIEEGEEYGYVLETLKHQTELFLGIKKDGASKSPSEVNLKVAETSKETAAKEEKPETKKATVTKKKRTQKSAETAEETPVIISLEDLKDAAKKVYKLRGKAVYEAIMEKFGVAKTDAIDEADYPKAMAEFDKAASEK